MDSLQCLSCVLKTIKNRLAAIIKEYRYLVRTPKARRENDDYVSNVKHLIDKGSKLFDIYLDDKATREEKEKE